MTSIVKVAAHCADNKEVQVLVTVNDEVKESFVLQNGESREVLIYDERTVTTFEQVKEVQAV